MTAPDLSAEERAVVARFEAAPPAPESDDLKLWATLSELIPCNDFAGCADECECAEGELRLAVMRLIIAERVHHVDCGDDEDCCDTTAHRARLVNKAAALSPGHLSPSPDSEAVARVVSEQVGHFHVLADQIDANADEFGATARAATGSQETERLVAASVHACASMVREFTDRLRAALGTGDREGGR